jgi:hypothetical protein
MFRNCRAYNLICSRVKWILGGENLSQYFCSLEKKNYTSKIIYKIKKDDGTIVKKQTAILEKLEKYYQNLFMTKIHNENDNSLDDFSSNIQGPVLSPTESNALEGQINYHEATFT